MKIAGKQQKEVKTIKGFSPYYSPSNLTAFSQVKKMVRQPINKYDICTVINLTDNRFSWSANGRQCVTSLASYCFGIFWWLASL
jgi:hypothetical protein